MEEHCKQQNEAISPLLTEEGSGKEVVEEPQKLILNPLPTKLNPSATAQATNSPLPAVSSPDLMHILPILVAHSTHETPTAKAIPSALPVQYLICAIVGMRNQQNLYPKAPTVVAKLLQYSGLWSNSGMGFLRTNDSQFIETGEFQFGFGVLLKTVGVDGLKLKIKTS